jgi:expansin
MHAPNRSRFRAPWLVVALAAIGVMALAVGIVHFAPSPCPGALHGPVYGQLRAAWQPARPQAGSGSVSGSGQAFFYDPGTGGDKCSIAPLDPDGLYASLPSARYADGSLCGAYLDITGPLGTVRAQIVDMCPGCSDSQLDLSTAAFARIQYQSRGTADVSWQLAVNPVLPGPLAVRVGPGSTASDLALLVLNHGNPLTSVSVDGKPATQRADGYWIGVGDGPGPFQVQVTDAAGHTAVLTGIKLSPQAIQQTSVRMYGAAPQPTPAPAPVPPTPTPPAITPATSAPAVSVPAATVPAVSVPASGVAVRATSTSSC